MAAPVKKRVRNYSSQHCAAINCTNARHNNPDLSYFRFPKDPERSKWWVQNSRRDDLGKKTPQQLYISCVLCSEHFEPNQFVNPTTRSRLYGTAIPTLFSVPNPPKPLTSKRPRPRERKAPVKHIPSEQQTETSVPDNASQSTSVSVSPEILSTSRKAQLTPKKLELKKQVAALKKKVNRRDNAMERLDRKVIQQKKFDDVRSTLSQFVSGTALDFIMSQVEMSSKSKNGRRWGKDTKSLALTLMHSSPKTYQLLSKIFILPATSTLKRDLMKINLDTGFNKTVMDAFRVKVSAMEPADRLCVLLFDEMAIKEFLSYNSKEDKVEGFEDFGRAKRGNFIANQACVFMARGYMKNWKQPFGYFFSSGPVKKFYLSELIINAVRELTRIGLNVVAFVCDQGPNNRAALKLMGVSLQQPYFLFEGHKIFVFYDPPHLLKNIRNNLKKHGFQCGQHIADWQHISDFYNRDCQLPVRLAPKLNARHIELPPFSAMRVRLAAQVLSHSVYAGMSTLRSFGALPEESQATAEFAKRMDSLFNCFNSYSLKATRPYQYAFSRTSSHTNFLMETFQWLSTVRSRSKSQQPLPCIEGWQLCIQSLFGLFEEMSANQASTFILTSRLNQDCLENLFSIIRGKGGHRDNPSSQDFKSAMKQIMVDRLFLSSSRKNCQDDLDSFFFQLDGSSREAEEAPFSFPKPQPVLQPAVAVSEHDVDASITLQETNVMGYIAGYIARKMETKICAECFSKLKGDLSSDEDKVFIRFKQYDYCTKGLVAPSNLLANACIYLEEKYNHLGTDICFWDNVKSTLNCRLLGHIQRLGIFNDFCLSNCKTAEKVVQLFINIRFHHTIKLNNQKFAEEKKKKNKRNRKMLKLSHL